jgi:hypothetical protein
VSGGDDGDVVGVGAEGGGYGEEGVFGADFAGDQGAEGAEAEAGSRQAAAGSVGGLLLVPVDAAFGAVRGDDEVDVDRFGGQAERAAGVAEEDMTPAVSWSARSLSKRWNEVKDTEAPWWREVSMHAFRSGIVAAADGLKNWHESKTGKRKGRRMGFPAFKSKRRSTPSVSFVEINHQLSWLAPDRHHIRLMLPQSSPDPDLVRRRHLVGWLHTVSSALAGAFEVVAVEDLNIKGMANRKRHLGRCLADAGLGELRRQLTYKAADRGHRLVAVGRFYPSSKTCSHCGAVKAKLPMWERVFTCDDCGTTLDRDVNAARSIAREASRLLDPNHDTQDQHDGAGLRPDSANAAPRPGKTAEASADAAGSLEGGTKQPPPRRAAA